MSWSINANGQRDAVRETVRTHEYKPFIGDCPEHEKHHDTIRDAIVAAIDQAPEGVEEVWVEAYGHTGGTVFNIGVKVSGSRNLAPVEQRS